MTGITRTLFTLMTFAWLSLASAWLLAHHAGLAEWIVAWTAPALILMAVKWINH